MGIDDRIRDLEEKLEETPVNKATEKERARLKSRIAELKEEKQQKQKGTGETSGYAVKKHGDATVALVGFPSVGKSSLLNELTNAEAETGEYEFTTLDVNPGILEYKGAKLQILDVPGLIGGAASGRGGGKQVLSVVRTADLAVIVLDPEEMREEEIKSEVRDVGIRLNERPPKVRVEKKERGGVKVNSKASIKDETIREVAEEKGFTNAEVTVMEEMGLDRFVDGLMDNRVYMPGITVVNKADSVDESFDHLEISAKTGEGLEELKQRIFESLGLKRVYMKHDGEVDREDPLMLRGGDTVEDALEALPGDKKRKFKEARVTGPSAKFPDQEVGLDHVLKDEDVLQLNLKKL